MKDSNMKMLKEGEYAKKKISLRDLSLFNFMLHVRAPDDISFESCLHIKIQSHYSTTGGL